MDINWRDEYDLAIQERNRAIMNGGQWQARAEAAEDDLRELRENTLLALGLNPLDVTYGMEDQSISYLLGGLKERITMLEARLAAQAWQPVSEPPDKAGEYLGWEADGARRLIIVTYDPDLDYEDSWAWSDWYDEATPITHWRPLPPPPTATE